MLEIYRHCMLLSAVSVDGCGVTGILNLCVRYRQRITWNLQAVKERGILMTTSLFHSSGAVLSC